MTDIFLDIETVPSQRPEVKEWIAETISHPKQMKKAETIERWEQEDKPDAIEKTWRDTSFDGGFGEIISIGYAFNDMPEKCLIRKLEESEKNLSETFFKIIDEQTHFKHNYRFIGHDILRFDLRFIFQRCLVLGIKPTLILPYLDAKDPNKVFDTGRFWCGYFNKNDYVKLDKLCRIFGIKSSKEGGMDGSKVWDLVRDGEYEKVAEYNKKDIRATRELFYKMTGGKNNGGSII